MSRQFVGLSHESAGDNGPKPSLAAENLLKRCRVAAVRKEAKRREELEALIESQLSNHWGDRAAAIVIDPELENWVWTDSPHVAQAIGWRGDIAALRTWLQNQGLLEESRAKPTDPKAALETALARMRKPKSSSLFAEIASKVSLRACTDPAFQKLKTTLQHWFPEVPNW